MLAKSRDSSSCNVTFGPSVVTRAVSWDGGDCDGGGRSEWPHPGAAVVKDTPPSPASPNPYKRKGLLRRRSPPPPQRKIDLDNLSSSQGTTGELRPPPPMSPPDSYFHDKVANDVLYATAAAGAEDSPLLLDFSWRGSRASSRSASPHKRPWYPAGPRPSPGGNDSPNGGGGDESAYVVHPTFRHMFEKRANGSDANRRSRVVYGRGDARVGDSRGASPRQSGPTHGAGGVSRLSPTKTAVKSQRSERGRTTGSATGGGGRERTSAHFSTEEMNTSGEQRWCAPTTGQGLRRVVNGRRASSTQDGDALSPPIKSVARVGPNSDAFSGTRSNNRIIGTEQSYAGRGKVGQREHSRGTSREMIATVRGSVRDLQTSRDRPRRQEIQEGLSARNNSSGGGDPSLRSSAVFLGHTEQVLALARHKDILFSAAADGTAKVARFSFP